MKHVIILLLLATSLSACNNTNNSSLTPEQNQRLTDNMSEVQTRH